MPRGRADMCVRSEAPLQQMPAGQGVRHPTRRMCSHILSCGVHALERVGAGIRAQALLLVEKLESVSDALLGEATRSWSPQVVSQTSEASTVP